MEKEREEDVRENGSFCRPPEGQVSPIGCLSGFASDRRFVNSRHAKIIFAPDANGKTQHTTQRDKQTHGHRHTSRRTLTRYRNSLQKRTHIRILHKHHVNVL